MNSSEACGVLATIEGLFPKWDLTDELRSVWLRKIERCGYAPGQIRWGAEEHRMGHRFHDPNWQSIMTCCQRCPEVNGAERRNPKAEQDAAADAFGRKRAATNAWIAQASEQEIEEIKDRAALHHERTGCPGYADRIRNPRSDDPAILGEIAYLTGGQRIADVWVTGDGARLLCLGQRRLERLSNTEPALAARFLGNLARALARRMAGATRPEAVAAGSRAGR